MAKEQIKPEDDYVKMYPVFKKMIETQKLSPTETKILWACVFNSEMHTNHIQNPDMSRMTIFDFSMLAGVHEKTMERTLPKMIRKEIIDRVFVDGQNHVVLNPYLAHRGPEVRTDIRRHFMNSKWAKMSRE